MVDENEVKALADRLYDAAVSNAGSPSISVWETAQHAAREALRWRDETRPQQPAALAVPAVDKARFESAPCYLCGYNGPGYYQPSQHPCAAGYHAQQPAALADAEEDAYVIERMGKLLAEIAIIVNGTQPHDTLWSYHDLPEKVSALKQAQQPAAAVAADLPTITREEARDRLGWKGMDGAIAYHLIDRHAENWADVGLMMNAWFEANTQAPPAPPAAVPEGYALVPVELTQPMIDAAWSILGGDEGPTDGQIYDAWAVMLAAANKENNNE